MVVAGLEAEAEAGHLVPLTLAAAQPEERLAPEAEAEAAPPLLALQRAAVQPEPEARLG